MFIKYLIPLILIIGIVATISYYDYLIWLKPIKFKEDQIKNVKNWWPFANFFRRWFNTTLFLWAIRVVYTVVTLALIFVICVAVIKVLGLI
jgi:hypothetical protein